MRDIPNTQVSPASSEDRPSPDGPDVAGRPPLGRQPSETERPEPQPHARDGRSINENPGGITAAWRFLFCSSAWTEHTAPRSAARGVGWIAPLGLLIGLAWVAVFRAAWRLYGDPDMTRMRVLPAAAILLLESLLTGRLLLIGLARSAQPADRESARRANGDLAPLIAVVVYLITAWSLVLSIPERIGWYAGADDWRRHFNDFYPIATYRPLLLAPLWGRWAILLAAGIGRPAPDADAATRAFCAAVRPGRVLLWMIGPLLLTALYANREGALAAGLIVSLLVLFVSYVTAFALARRHGGQSRSTLLGTAAIGQVAFLAVYRALCV